MDVTLAPAPTPNATLVPCDYTVPAAVHVSVIVAVVVGAFLLMWAVTCASGLTPLPRGVCGSDDVNGAAPSGHLSAGVDDDDGYGGRRDSGDGLFEGRTPRAAAGTSSSGVAAGASFSDERVGARVSTGGTMGATGEATGLLSAAAPAPTRASS